MLGAAGWARFPVLPSLPSLPVQDPEKTSRGVGGGTKAGAWGAALKAGDTAGNKADAAPAQAIHLSQKRRDEVTDYNSGDLCTRGFTGKQVLGAQARDPESPLCGKGMRASPGGGVSLARRRRRRRRMRRRRKFWGAEGTAGAKACR